MRKAAKNTLILSVTGTFMMFLFMILFIGGIPNEKASVNEGVVYEVNSQGLTYGSVKDNDLTDEDPDFIYALGKNKKIGYIKSEDLNSQIDITEMVEIPLYSDNFIDIIDTFEVEPSKISNAGDSIQPLAYNPWRYGRQSTVNANGQKYSIQNSVRLDPATRKFQSCTNIMKNTGGQFYAGEAMTQTMICNETGYAIKTSGWTTSSSGYETKAFAETVHWYPVIIKGRVTVGGKTYNPPNTGKING